MVKIYNTDMETNKTTLIDKYEKGSWIRLVNPTEDEIKEVCKNVKLSDEFIRESLDYDEKARIDYEEDEDSTLFVVDIPIIEMEGDNEIYTTMPLGMIVVRDEFFITVSLKKNDVIESFVKNKVKNFCTYKKSRLLLQILYKNASQFLSMLKQMNKEKELAEVALRSSMKNKELLKMLSLEKSLVYFTTSLRSNEVIMEKTMRGKVMKLYEEDEDLLEDAIVENKQAIEMAKIYSDILSGTMDAYASIISNNLNIVMKFLTSITIIISIPTLVASFWGMNVPVPFENNANGFVILIVISIVVTVLSIMMLNKKGMLK